MVSQGCNCDSDGVPGFMQDCTEVDSLEAIKARREVEDFPILVGSGADEQFSEKTKASSSGGIRVACEEIQEVQEDPLEEEDVMVEDNRDAIERETVNRATKMAFAMNKNERHELIAIRHKMIEMVELLKRHGISWADAEAEALLKKAAFNNNLGADSLFVEGRDEFGLPILKQRNDRSEEVHNPFVDKMKAKENDVVDPPGLEKTGGKVSETGPEKEKGTFVETAKPSWSNVLKNPPPPANNITFDFFPLPTGTKIVSPPVEVLKEGNDKFKNCVIGTFSRGAVPLSTVAEFARSEWQARGLVSIAQKDRHIFFFKFNSVAAMNWVLSRGTWYVGKNPLIVRAWGAPLRANLIETIPLWVKFSKVPDCYWTRKGLSYLGSVIGAPLCADELTSKLEILPFAKLCVNYKVGNPLPEKIEVEALDPCTGETTIEEVIVSYPVKPLFCSACNSLGHKVGACPSAKKFWVQRHKEEVSKSKAEGCSNQKTDENKGDRVEESSKQKDETVPETQPNPGQEPVPENQPDAPSTKDVEAKPEATPQKNNVVDDNEGWTRVTNKRHHQSPLSDISPSPETSKGSSQVNEAEKKKGAGIGLNAQSGRRKHKKSRGHGTSPKIR